MVRGLFSEYSEPFRSQICTQKGRKVDRMDALQIFLIAQEEANEQEHRHGRHLLSSAVKLSLRCLLVSAMALEYLSKDLLKISLLRPIIYVNRYCTCGQAAYNVHVSGTGTRVKCTPLASFYCRIYCYCSSARLPLLRNPLATLQRI